MISPLSFVTPRIDFNINEPLRKKWNESQRTYYFLTIYNKNKVFEKT